ncbi:MAG: S41 family peptidase [Patescibacteria group bacterium]|nr:S41 family peptidase [Patescibacteria group bacterium]
MFKNFLKASLAIFLLIFVFLLGLTVGEEQDFRKTITDGKVIINKNALKENSGNSIDFNLFWEVWDIIQNNYVDGPVPNEQLFYGALAGEVASLGDPYSIFLDPEISKEFERELSSEFEGIGAEIGIKNKMLIVISPLPDSPAEKAGLKSGDKIYKIDGKEAVHLTLNEAVSLIRGDAGTKVVLTVFREGEDSEIDIEIIRNKIHFDTVKWEIKNNNILYVEISHFNYDTEELFNKMANENLNKNISGIILDLRGNPGGFLDVAVDIAGKWIRKGDVVVMEKFSETNKLYHRSDGRGEFAGIPTIVLINEGSASASEIIAGALQDYNLATLLGEKTFGKGSVQDLRSLSDGSKIKITIAKWLTPKERAIDMEGIEPDIEIELTDEDYNNDRDTQLDKALEILRK